jgi:hypothetical protein
MRACRWSKKGTAWVLAKRTKRCIITGHGTGSNRTYKLTCTGTELNWYESLSTAKARGCRRLKK